MYTTEIKNSGAVNLGEGESSRNQTLIPNYHRSASPTLVVWTPAVFVSIPAGSIELLVLTLIAVLWLIEKVNKHSLVPRCTNLIFMAGVRCGLLHGRCWSRGYVKSSLSS